MQSALVTLILAAALAQPQLRPAAEPPRYVPIPLPDNAEDLLKSIQFEPTPASPVSPEMTKEITDKLTKMFSGPDGNEKLEESVKKLFSKWIESHPKEAKENKFDLKEITKFATKELAREANEAKLDKSKIPDAPVPIAPAPKSLTLDQRVGRWLADWLQNEETGGRLVEFMRESPAFQGALEDLLRSVNEVDAGWQPNLPAMPDAFAPPPLPGFGELPKFPMPELPDAQGWWPKLPRLQMPAFSMPQFPDFSSPKLPDIGGDWPQIVLAVLLVVGLVLAMRLWTIRTPVAADRPLMPLPAAIATRAELRLAFEALALNRFGAEAKPWNHRRVAERFGGGPAIEELARLYEQARYAPDDGPLSTDDRAAATRSVAELAGGAA
jgi:hypothetical protein